MSEITDAPIVVRRRRRIARLREKTPEPSAKSGGVKPKYSDDESSSTADQGNESRPNSACTSISTGMSAHRSKILNRRDKGCGNSGLRSQSQPRKEVEEANLDIALQIRQVKRSLSSPRYNLLYIYLIF